jgi:hypothetical protein
MVNPDRSKTFHGSEIRPYDTNFDFEHNTRNLVIKAPRELARWKSDPQNLGAKYDIKFPTDGTGRVYYPFTDTQLSAAVRDRDNAPPGLLPSFAAAPPPFIKEHLQYLDQTNGQSTPPPQTGGILGISSDTPVRTLSRANGNNSPAPAFESGAPPARFVLPSPPNSSGGLADWIAALAGVDPRNPMQAAPSPQMDQLRGVDRDDPTQPWFAPRQR